MVIRIALFSLIVLFMAQYACAQSSREQLKKADSLSEISSDEAEKILFNVAQDKSVGNLYNAGVAYRMIANICASHSRNAGQIDYLFQSYSAFEKANETSQLPEAMRLIGHYYFYMKLNKEADKFLQKAYSLALAQHDTIAQINTASNLAQLAMANGNLDNAKSFYETAIELSEKKNYRKGLLENWNRISYAHQKSGEPKAYA